MHALSRFLLIIVQKYFSIIVGSTCRESVCYAYYENMFILFLLVIIIKGEYNISYVLLNVVICGTKCHKLCYDLVLVYLCMYITFSGTLLQNDTQENFLHSRVLRC